MKIEIYSREAMEKRLQEGFLQNTAVISIFDPPSVRIQIYYSVYFFLI